MSYSYQDFAIPFNDLCEQYLFADTAILHSLWNDSELLAKNGNYKEVRRELEVSDIETSLSVLLDRLMDDISVNEMMFRVYGCMSFTRYSPIRSTIGMYNVVPENELFLLAHLIAWKDKNNNVVEAVCKVLESLKQHGWLTVLPMSRILSSPHLFDNHLLSLLNTIPAKYVSGEIETPSNEEMKRIARIYSLLKNEYICFLMGMPKISDDNYMVLFLMTEFVANSLMIPLDDNAMQKVRDWQQPCINEQIDKFVNLVNKVAYSRTEVMRKELYRNLAFCLAMYGVSPEQIQVYGLTKEKTGFSSNWIDVNYFKQNEYGLDLLNFSVNAAFDCNKKTGVFHYAKDRQTSINYVDCSFKRLMRDYVSESKYDLKASYFSWNEKNLLNSIFHLYQDALFSSVRRNTGIDFRGDMLSLWLGCSDNNLLYFAGFVLQQYLLSIKTVHADVVDCCKLIKEISTLKHNQYVEIYEFIHDIVSDIPSHFDGKLAIAHFYVATLVKLVKCKLEISKKELKKEELKEEAKQYLKLSMDNDFKEEVVSIFGISDIDWEAIYSHFVEGDNSKIGVLVKPNTSDDSETSHEHIEMVEPAEDKVNPSISFEFMQDNYPQFSNMTQYVQTMVSAYKAGKRKYLTPLMLCGGRGNGKTRYLSDLAKYLQVEFESYDIGNAVSDGEFLGHEAHYSDSYAGVLYRTHVCVEGKPVLFVFDSFNDSRFNIDSSRTNGHLNLQRVFNTVLNTDNLSRMYDHHEREYFDMSNFLLVFCDTDTKEIPDFLLRKLKVFEEKSISKDERLSIYINMLEEVFENNGYNETLDKPLSDVLTKSDTSSKLAHDLMLFLSRNNLSAVKSLFEELVFDYCETQGVEEQVLHHMEKANSRRFESLSRKYNVVSPERLKAGFNEIHGLHEVKQYCRDIMQMFKVQVDAYFKDKSLLDNDDEEVLLSVERPLKGFILQGEPGCGKTMIASAIAKECGLPFISLTGNSFTDKYVGVGSKSVRELFSFIRNEVSEPCVLFIDEMDALGNRETTNINAPHEIINELLTQLDGLEKQPVPIFVIGATNFIDNIDPALRRSGRFDKVIKINKPTLAERKELVAGMVSSNKFENADIERIARITAGYSSADLVNILDNSVIIAIRHKHTKVLQSDIDESVEEVMLGFKTIKQSLEEMKLTAVHEAGHACISYLCERNNVLSKVTVVPRSNALGITFFAPEKDGLSSDKNDFMARIMTSMAGQCAEYVLCGRQTSGASGDIKSITQTAMKMVRELGFSFNSIELSDVMLNYNDMELSEMTKKMLDDEAMSICRIARERCVQLLEQHRDFVQAVADKLVEQEVVVLEEVETIAKQFGITRSMCHQFELIQSKSS